MDQKTISEPRPKLRLRGDAGTQRQLLHLIRLHQPITRTTLSELTRLPLSTVTFNVNRLLRSDWVYETSSNPPKSGRPSRYLHINAKKMCLIGLDIGVADTVLAIADYNAHILYRQQWPTEREPGKFLQKISKQAMEAIEGEYKDYVMGPFGVSLPGLVDTMTGQLVRAPNLGWSNVPVLAMLQELIGMPVVVENDANAAALAEISQRLPITERVKNILYVLVVEGLGTAFVADGRIYRGSRIGTGGFGHMCLDPQGPACTCGGRGCLETYVSNQAIRNAYRGSGPTGHGVIAVSDIIQLALRGELQAVTVITDVARKLGDGLRNLVHGLSPQRVVIGGELAAAFPLIGPVISQQMKSQFFVPELAGVEVVPSSISNRPSLIGALVLGIFPEFLTKPHDI